MAFSTVPTVVVGQLHTAAMWNTYIRDNGNWYGTRKGFLISRVAAQSLPNNATTLVSFDTETVDTDGFGAVPSTAYTVPSGLDGIYSITGTVALAGSGGADAFARLIVGGVVADSGRISTVGLNVSVSATVAMAATNTFTLSVFQNSGAALNATATLRAYFVGR